MDYVADTHAILWHLFNPDRLGPGARSAFLDADSGVARIFLPAVVIAEMIMVIERQRLPGTSIPQLIRLFQVIQTSANYILFPLLPEAAMASHALTAIPDIFDRLIVADAQRLGVPLISRDSVISASGLVNVVWA